MSSYWISPKGEKILVTGTHTEYVLSNPAKFGFSHVGEFRLAAVFKRGWIRVREMPDEIHMETGRLDAKTAGNIKCFCEKSDYSHDMKVVIQVTEPRPKVMRITVKEVLDGKLKSN